VKAIERVDNIYVIGFEEFDDSIVLEFFA